VLTVERDQQNKHFIKKWLPRQETSITTTKNNHINDNHDKKRKKTKKKKSLSLS
jgi:hypothetical protein|tara:strand:- start:1715 stop:1876 length:162 start_codon:yes stop_codon:yes gene_type:complete